MSLERYSRQTCYKNLRKNGQEKLLNSHVAIVGMGALGCVSANELARAGIGHLVIIDRDLVELSNLQRQVLYTEADARESVPKVSAAADHLLAANSEIHIVPVFSDLNASNISTLFQGMDLIVDATDNMETRYLINEYCVEHQIPWVYGGAVESEGMTANFIPEGPCLSCLLGHTHTTPTAASGRSCSSVGVLNTLTAIVASIQATEVIKILTGSTNIRKNLLFFEIWDNEFQSLPIEKNPDCPICSKHHYQYLNHATGTKSINLCGKNAWQIIPEGNITPNFEILAEKLSPLGTVTINAFSLKFSSKEATFQLFKDGRAMISNAINEGQAKSIYSEYIGL